jgi:hypothetical protein
MRPKRLVPVFVGVVCLAAAVACNDTAAPNRSPSTPFTPASPAGPTLVTIAGSVHVTGRDGASLILLTDDGYEVALNGGGAALARVDGADVEVRGGWNADESFDVSDFLVRKVDGVPVMDGVLISLDDFVDDAHTNAALVYAILLTRGGMVMLNDPPAALTEHLGARVWVADSGDRSPTAFGIISE